MRLDYTKRKHLTVELLALGSLNVIAKQLLGILIWSIQIMCLLVSNTPYTFHPKTKTLLPNIGKILQTQSVWRNAAGGGIWAVGSGGIRDLCIKAKPACLGGFCVWAYKGWNLFQLNGMPCQTPSILTSSSSFPQFRVTARMQDSRNNNRLVGFVNGIMNHIGKNV